MKFNLNGKYFEEKESDAIYNELLSIVAPVSSDTKSQLIIVFNYTQDARVRDKIALIFADLSDKELIPILVKKITEIKYSKHISTLIYACSEYDCAEWIEFFVGIAIDLDDSSYLGAIGVIEEMRSPIKLSDKVICVKRITDYLSSLNDNKSEKYSDIESVLELIETMETTY